MNYRYALAGAVALLALVPIPAAAQRGLRDTLANPTTPEDLALAFGVYVAVTLVIGATVLTVDRSYVRSIETRLRDDPVSAGVIGLGVLVGGFVAFAAMGAVVALLVDAGAPAALESVPTLVGIGVSVGLTVINTIGMIVAGLVVLRRLRDEPEPNPWLALVVGALVVQVLYLVPLLNLAVAVFVVALATGAIVGQWWQGRAGEPSESEPSQQTADS
ncbi:hypothetical protein E2L06_13975 [Haloterrigena sp. H1]|uniref:DUF1345 domain-containing protein n=1 Tax=Haloterrigena sp. H1 TaxID=2552943 RepID=UPI00110EB7EB|nr:DUF1345 domain-containing protein [Haloterrigena sp. H1]TMT87633.1 hypothetical protein E2L06_13975 [Haloterrigena sp. H1]